MLTDLISNLLFVPSEISKENLKKEGISNNVHIGGNIMKHLVLKALDNVRITKPKTEIESCYYFTLHSPYNTD